MFLEEDTLTFMDKVKEFYNQIVINICNLNRYFSRLYFISAFWTNRFYLCPLKNAIWMKNMFSWAIQNYNFLFFFEIF